MMQLLDSFIISARCRLVRSAERFREESGVSSFVATILLIVIVVALCALFWTNISQWFANTWLSIMGDASKIGN